MLILWFLLGKRFVQANRVKPLSVSKISSSTVALAKERWIPRRVLIQWNLVPCLLNNMAFVAIKIGRGPAAAGRGVEHI